LGVFVGIDYEVLIDALGSSRSSNLFGISSATAYIDAYIYIDPIWALDHPGYSIPVSDGIGNAAPADALVPEPGTLALMALALARMGGLRRRKS
jgi:hypothetical protein